MFFKVRTAGQFEKHLEKLESWIDAHDQEILAGTVMS